MSRIGVAVGRVSRPVLDLLRAGGIRRDGRILTNPSTAALTLRNDKGRAGRDWSPVLRLYYPPPRRISEPENRI